LREFLRLAGILTLVSIISAWALSSTYNITKPIIDLKRYQKKIEALSQVLPPFDNQPDKEIVKLTTEKGEVIEFYVGRKKGELTGVAFKKNTVGYGGNIALMIGVTPQGKIYGIQVMEQNETPGLGAKISHPNFLQQFTNKDLASTRWEVKKMGGDFDQISAATVSSRAITKGIKEGLNFFQSNKEKILKQG
jgi:electron transport complex protein RnfG